MITRPQKGKRSKRAFSGNTRRIPLETGSKVKLPKIRNENSINQNIPGVNRINKNSEDIKSDIEKRNGMSLSESQKESAKGIPLYIKLQDQVISNQIFQTVKLEVEFHIPAQQAKRILILQR